MEEDDSLEEEEEEEEDDDDDDDDRCATESLALVWQLKKAPTPLVVVNKQDVRQLIRYTCGFHFMMLWYGSGSMMFGCWDNLDG